MVRAVLKGDPRVTGLKVPPLVWALAACVGALGILGAYNALVSEVPAFSLQEELRNGFNVPVLFAGVILLLAAALGARIARAASSNRRIWAGLAVLFTFMAFDETLLIHEDLQRAVDVEWQILYIPIFLFALTLWIAVLRACSGSERFLWIAGAAAWGSVQLLEAIGHVREGREPTETAAGGGALRAVEELGELTGTTLFIWALLLIVARHARENAHTPA
jgi:hypothetical protein